MIPDYFLPNPINKPANNDKIIFIAAVFLFQDPALKEG